MKQPLAKGGFSLLETLLSMALMSLFLVLVMSFFLLGLKTYKSGYDQIELQQNARMAMFSIDRSLRYAADYSIIDDSRAVVFFVQDDSRSHTLRERRGDLEHLIGSTVTKVASHLSSLHFSVKESGLIHYTVVVSKGEKEYTLSSSVKPRSGM